MSAHGDDAAFVEVVADEGPTRLSVAHAPEPGRRSWRGLTALAVVVLVAVTAVAQTVEHRQEAAREARFAAMVGTVPRIDGPFESVWWEESWYSTYQDLGDAVVFFGSGGEVRAVDGATGAERWTLDEPVLGCWPPGGAVRDGAEVPRAGDGATLLCRGRSPATGSPDVVTRLLLVSGRTGDVLAERVVSTPAYTPALVGDDVVLVRAERDALVVDRVGVVDDELRWRVRLPTVPRGVRGTGQVTVHDGLLVLRGPVMAVLDAESGEALEAGVPEEPGGGAVFADLRILRSGYAVRTHGQVGWYDRAGRTITALPGMPVEPAVTDGSDAEVVLAETPDLTELVGVDLGSGEERWRTGNGRVLIARDGQVVVTRSGEVVALDVASGEVRWRTSVPRVSPRAGAVTDARTVVVVTVADGASRLVALDLDDGAVRWDQAMPTVPSPTTDALRHDEPSVRLGVLGGRAVVLSEVGITGLG